MFGIKDHELGEPIRRRGHGVELKHKLNYAENCNFRCVECERNCPHELWRIDLSPTSKI